MVGISRQRYYRSFWITESKRAKADQVIQLVNSLRVMMPRLGTRKLYHMLEPSLQSLHVGRDKLFRILKANDMLIKPKRNYRITTDSHHRFRKHKNLIEDMLLEHPEQVWVSDITYIGGRDRNCYLSLVTDAYSKKIMGYDVSNSLAAQGALSALNMAIKQRMYKESLIHHSDRGLQYCSNDYQKILKKKNIKPSMTESYDPYANAIAERVNGILKQEFLLEDYHVNIQTMKLLVEDAITIYNTKRPHWSCYMKTPEQMHKQNRVKIRTYKNKYSCKDSPTTIS
ncbi:transposase InsO family protein [Chryseobacterium sp. 7]|uniref:IS3 family transposase n=1 Tax=Chryseobacterium sp. 7 TaxID=2035214 RepID=UPI000F23CD3B|nr:IS3 family transposase [Chryseobacterium sp. 7]RLJ31838.1 transposase InsO family protein [Chryseobacterium sp. 7]